MDVQIIDVADPVWMQTLQALPHDIYHLPGYVSLEAQRTQTIPEAILITDDHQQFFLPYLLRPCGPITSTGLETGSLDVLSPYGYPGPLFNEAAQQTSGFPDAAIASFQQALRDRGVCSAFLRLHPILNGTIHALVQADTLTPNGETVSIDLSLTESQMWNHTRPDHRNKINRCRRLGFTASMVPCDTHLEEFVEIYLETMQRVGATAGYLEFDQTYFTRLYDELGETLHLCIVALENQVVSAGLYTEQGGIVQALFGGTKTEFLKQSPTSLETDYVRSWAKARGNRYLHLGGGLGGSKDRLYEFKAGFSRQRHPFYTLRLIINPQQYNNLVTHRANALQVPPDSLYQSHFFPAYRASLEVK